MSKRGSLRHRHHGLAGLVKYVQSACPKIPKEKQREVVSFFLKVAIVAGLIVWLMFKA